LALTGHFCVLTYITVLLEQKIGIASSHVAFYLFLFGVAGVVGNILVGRLADHYLQRACLWIMILMVVVVIALGCLSADAVMGAALLIMLWGAAICALTISLQSLILTLPAALTSIASAVYVSMYNAGIGGGALLGGMLIDHFPPQVLAWVGGTLLLLAAARLYQTKWASASR
jgi:predicted MFS family arabinose efflux permease